MTAYLNETEQGELLRLHSQNEGEVATYLRKIRNFEKKRYAYDYAAGKHEGKEYQLGYMGRQSVRLHIDALRERKA